MDTIGSTERVEIAGIKNIPAKIDTGADSSSIWASHIDVTEDGVLHFCLFGKGSPFYTGKTFARTDYKVAIVRSASGHEQIRYRTHLKVAVGGHTIKALFNLADRSHNNYPVLIGRRTITGKFLVDVSKNHIALPAKNSKSKVVQRLLSEDPYKFHRKYIKELGGNVNEISFKEKGV